MTYIKFKIKSLITINYGKCDNNTLVAINKCKVLVFLSNSWNESFYVIFSSKMLEKQLELTIILKI